MILQRYKLQLGSLRSYEVKLIAYKYHDKIIQFNVFLTFQHQLKKKSKNEVDRSKWLGRRIIFSK